MEIKTQYKFSEGLAPYKGSNGKFGYIDYKGNIKIEPKYEVVGAFNDGCASIGRYVREHIINVKFIDHKENLLPFDYDISYWDSFELGVLPYFKQGFCKLNELNPKPAIFINKKGEIPVALKDYDPLTDFNEDQLAEVRNTYGNKIINTKGEEIKVIQNGKEMGVPYSFFLLPFTESLKDALYHKSTRNPYVRIWSYFYFQYIEKDKAFYNINRKPFRYASRFDDGVACIQKEKDGHSIMCKKNFRKYQSWPSGYGYGSYDHDANDNIGEGLIPVVSKKGRNIYSIKSDSLIFENDYSFTYWVQGGAKNGMIKFKDMETRLFGYLNCINGTILKPIYKTATDFNEGFAYVYKDGKNLYINPFGDALISFKD